MPRPACPLCGMTTVVQTCPVQDCPGVPVNTNSLRYRLIDGPRAYDRHVKAQAVAVRKNAATPGGGTDMTAERRMLVEQYVANERRSVPMAFVLWLFLGAFGAHRFYLGRPGSALLLILFNLMLVGLLWTWLIEPFLIPGMARRERGRLRARAVANMGA